MTDEELARAVTDELFWDPKIDSQGIAVTADRGVITLRGTVGSFWQKREATKAAERVTGVVATQNKIDVVLMTEHRREDADLRADVLQALMLDLLVPATVDAWVEDGSVTLTGWANWQYQRDEAETVAGKVLGVADVSNRILLDDTAQAADDVKQKIRRAFERHARLDADRLEVTTANGTVTLTGTVHSRDEHDAAVAAAWSAPGIRAVEDRLTVA